MPVIGKILHKLSNAITEFNLFSMKNVAGEERYAMSEGQDNVRKEWEKPPDGFIKINCNGAMDPLINKGG